MCINLSKCMFCSSWTCFLSSPWQMCQNGRIACMFTMTCMLLNSLPWNQQHFSPRLLHASCWDGFITCTGVISSMCACCAPTIPIPGETHSLIYAAHVLPWVVSSAHATLPCFFLYLFSIFISHHQLIAWVSKVALIISGSAWACNFVLTLCFQQPSSCVHCVQVYYLLLLLMVLLVVMLLTYYLDVLVYEQLDVLIGKQAHRHFLGCKPCWALDGVLWLFPLEGHCTSISKRQTNTCDSWRHINTHGKKSVKRKPKQTWWLTCNIAMWLIVKVAEFPLRGRETDCRNYGRHSPGYHEANWLLELHNA